jgi:hypothetical protein
LQAVFYQSRRVSAPLFFPEKQFDGSRFPNAAGRLFLCFFIDFQGFA